MNTIKLNNTTFEIENYNRNTYFGGETINSTGSCSLTNADIADVNELGSTTITTLQIYHDNTLIYDLQDINAKIDSINEYLNGDRVSISVSFTFSNT